MDYVELSKRLVLLIKKFDRLDAESFSEVKQFVKVVKLASEVEEN